MGAFQSQLHPREWPQNEIDNLKADFIELAGSETTITYIQFKTLLNNPDEKKLKYIIVEDEKYDDLFTTIDLDGSGTLSWNEIEAFFVLFLKWNVDQKLEYIFKQFDKDGNNVIDKDEQTKLFKRIQLQKFNIQYEPPEEKAIGDYSNFLIRVMDENNDEKISETEWKSFAKDHPSMLMLLGIANY